MMSKNGSSRINLINWMCLILILGMNLSGCNLSKGYTGTPVKVLVVMMKWNKQPACPTPADCEPNMGVKVQEAVHEPRHTAPEYITLLDAAINKYYQNASYGQMYFDFELLANPDSPNGWWDSPYTLAEINKSEMSFKQVAINIAYTELGEDLNNYERVLFISNMQWRGGQTCCVNTPTPYYAFPGHWWKDDLNSTVQTNTTIPMIVSEVAEGSTDQELITLTSHELGHEIGAPDQYFGSAVGMGPWDIMANDWDFNLFSTWTKLDRGWIDWTANTTRMPCLIGTCEITTVLDPQEKKGNNALLIPVNSDSEFMGIMAECRMRINGDEGIPEEGVLVTLSNPYLNTAFSPTVSEVITNESYRYSLLQPGEIYFNQVYDVRIINLSQPGDATCTVKAERSVQLTPDVYITQGSILEGEVYDKYKSPDIWNDSSVNGDYVYPDYEEINTLPIINFDNNEVDVPSGYGDPISTTENNFVMFLIHNGGNVIAKDFRVNVYLRQPLTVSIQTENCGVPAGMMGVQSAIIPKLIGTTLVDELGPGQNFYGNRGYLTSSNAPLEIEVEIEPVDGELAVDNNIAYETYTHFFGETNIADAMGVNVSDQCKVGLPYLAMEVPAADGSTCENWDLKIEPSSGFIEPGETVNFNISGIPRPEARAGETCNSHFSILMPLTGVYTPVESFGFEARVVDPASLTCSTPAESSAPGAPVSVTGQLDPGKAEPVALAYTDPGGTRTLKNLQTLDNGQYQDEFIPALPGLWNVQAFWVGDSTHAPTESTVCRFNVEEEDADILTPTITPTTTPTHTPTPTPTASAAFGTPVLSTNEFHYMYDCVPDPAEVTIKVPFSNPAQGSNVYLFFRLRNIANNTLTAWNDGLAMTDLGNGTYQITISWDMIPEVSSLHGDSAEFQYQFVASNAPGAASLRSPVYTDILLSSCQ